MNLVRNKKAIVTHPVTLFFIGVIIGVILTILWANQTIAIQFPFCK